MSTHLTNGLRLALDQLQEMVASYRTRHPLPNWRQHLVWQDASRELALAGFVAGSIGDAFDVYCLEREAARTFQNHPSLIDGVGRRTGPISKEKSD